MALSKAEGRGGSREREPIQVLFAATCGEVLGFAAGELASGLKKMLGEEIGVSGSYELEGPQMQILLARPSHQPPPDLTGDAYRIAPAGGGVALQGGNERAVLHAVYRLFEEAGAL